MIKLTNKQAQSLRDLIDSFNLKNDSKLGQLTFVKLDNYDLSESPEEFVDFVKKSENYGINYAIEYDLFNIMNDEQSAIYPIDAKALATLTDTSIFGVDNETAHTVQKLIANLNKIGMPTTNIDVYFFNPDNEPVEK